MAKMNVTEKDFEAFFQATESLMAMSGTLDEGFDEEAYAINKQFKSFKRRYLKAKEESMNKMKSIFSMFAYWDRVHQFPDGHIKVENNLAWRRKYLHVRNSNKQLIF